MHTFRRCVQRYDGNHKIKSFSCLDQFLCMAFAQLTYRESLRDIEACLPCPTREALPHGESWWRLTQYPRQCQHRGYLDFGRLFSMDQAGAFFVTRAKCNTVYQRRYSHPISSAAQSRGVKCDQAIVLTGVNAKDDYPQSLRRIKYHDSNTGKTFNFLTNNFTVPAQTVADLYRYRWQVELFFKWIKQHLRIKAFYGTSENAVKSQIWIAISVYVLVAIIKKQLKLETVLYTILQILSLTLFEKIHLDQLLMIYDYKNEECSMDNQLNLFDLTLGQ